MSPDEGWESLFGPVKSKTYKQQMEELDEKETPTQAVPPDKAKKKKAKMSFQDFKKTLDIILSFDRLDTIVAERRDGAAEALFVKFNPKGVVDQDYNRRNKNRYIIVSKATLDIAREILLTHYEELMK